MASDFTWKNEIRAIERNSTTPANLEISMGMESKFDSKRTIVKSQSNLHYPFRILTFILMVFGWIGWASQTPCCAQTLPNNELRQSPAPFRPSSNPNTIPAGNQQQPPLDSATTFPNQAKTPQEYGLNTPQTFTANPLDKPVGSDSSPQSESPKLDDRDLGPGVTRVTKTRSTLPNSSGQVWREYDITPYTLQITSVKDPQKSITDWILRETGTEMWFHQPLGILNADRNRVLVYHTPEIQNIVKSIVDRFNRTRGQIQNIDVNLVTVENPNWRSKLYTMLQPIEVKSPGVEAWMVSKENAAILMNQLRQRTDFKAHNGGRISNHDGQSQVLEKKRPVQFVRNLRWSPNQIPNYQPIMTQVDEGYRLEISCLSAMDHSTIEAVIKCDVDQVEKLSTVKVNVPGAAGSPQQMSLQIPQLISWRLHERFRWPNDQVLLLSCGVVATPEPESHGGGLRIPGLPQKSNRADALLFFEYRGPAEGASVPKLPTSGWPRFEPDSDNTSNSAKVTSTRFESPLE